MSLNGHLNSQGNSSVNPAAPALFRHCSTARPRSSSIEHGYCASGQRASDFVTLRSATTARADVWLGPPRGGATMGNRRFTARSRSGETGAAGPASSRLPSLRPARTGVALALGVALCAAPFVAGPPSAQAAGHVIVAGTPLHIGADSVAVDSTGTAYIAWSNTTDLAGGPNFVQYCVLPVGATA